MWDQISKLYENSAHSVRELAKAKKKRHYEVSIFSKCMKVPVCQKRWKQSHNSVAALQVFSVRSLMRLQRVVHWERQSAEIWLSPEGLCLNVLNILRFTLPDESCVLKLHVLISFNDDADWILFISLFFTGSGKRGRHENSIKQLTTVYPTPQDESNCDSILLQQSLEIVWGREKGVTQQVGFQFSHIKGATVPKTQPSERVIGVGWSAQIALICHLSPSHCFIFSPSCPPIEYLLCAAGLHIPFLH